MTTTSLHEATGPALQKDAVARELLAEAQVQLVAVAAPAYERLPLPLAQAAAVILTRAATARTLPQVFPEDHQRVRDRFIKRGYPSPKRILEQCRLWLVIALLRGGTSHGAISRLLGFRANGDLNRYIRRLTGTELLALTYSDWTPDLASAMQPLGTEDEGRA